MIKTNNMHLPQEFRKKWINALESKKYQQTTEVLCDEYGFCAIGVALIAAGNVPIDRIKDVSNINKDLINDYNLPFISDCDEILDCIIELNDTEKNTFEEIADWIEDNVDSIDYDGMEEEANARNVSIETVMNDWNNGSKNN